MRNMLAVSNPNYTKWRKIVCLVIVLTIFSSACISSKIPDLQTPPGSVETKSTLEIGRQLDSVERKILLFLKENNYKNAESKIRLLDKSASMQDIGKFYDEQLIKIGFNKDSIPEIKPENSETSTWKKREWLSEQIVIVSVIENRQAQNGELMDKTLLTYTAAK